MIADLICAEHELEHVWQREVLAKELLVHYVEALLDEVLEERHVAHGEQPVVWPVAVSLGSEGPEDSERRA